MNPRRFVVSRRRLLPIRSSLHFNVYWTMPQLLEIVPSWSRSILMEIDDVVIQTSTYVPNFDDDSDPPAILQSSQTRPTIDLHIVLTASYAKLPELPKMLYRYNLNDDRLGFLAYFIHAADSSAFRSVSFVCSHPRVEDLLQRRRARISEAWPDHFLLCSSTQAEGRTRALLEEARDKEEDATTPGAGDTPDGGEDE
jgi:hypothetical protein